jgi:subtilisin family serine protease
MAIRRLVVLNQAPQLRDAFMQRDASPAEKHVSERVQAAGATVESQVPQWTPLGPTGARLTRIDELFDTPHGYVVSAVFDDQEALHRFRADRAGDVVGDYSNPVIRPFEHVCPTDAVGNIEDVLRHLNVGPLHQANLKGQGVRVAICDSGLSDEDIPVAGGFTGKGFLPVGKAPVSHGTMVAFDARLVAKSAKFLDFPLLRQGLHHSLGVLEDAMVVFNELLRVLLSEPGPLVAVNSWGLYSLEEDAIEGDDANYSANANHPFNLLTGRLVAAGADVLFAAGNCGGGCPFIDCRAEDSGARSIHGANSHPDVITIGSTTTEARLLGYSSEGPGKLDPAKPDVVAPSHFSGSGIGGMADTGTSAACGLAAGVVAVLRSTQQGAGVSPARLKTALLETARQLPGIQEQHSHRTGRGVIDAAGALTHLGSA